MSLRKVAALLAAFGLLVGTIGSGVGAQFLDQVTATQNIDVGTFACKIVDATPQAASDGIAVDGKSLTFTADPILSSAAGSSPFTFTVKNTGSIPQALTVSTTDPDAPFSIIGAPFAAVPLAADATHTFSTGVEWGTLTNDNLGATESVTWTVNCGETQTVESAPLEYGPLGWGGWSCPEGTQVISATVEGGDLASLILWRPGASTDGVSYPNTPFGYTYDVGLNPPEEGAIGQNDNDSGEAIVIVLTCTQPTGG